MELILVLVLISVMAAIALPRFGGAQAHMTGLSAARRIVAEIEWIRSEAMRLQETKLIWFRTALNKIDMSELEDPNHPGKSYVIELAQEMPGVKLISASFGDEPNKLRFDAWGVPEDGGDVVIGVGNETWTINVDADTGRATIVN